EGADFRVGSNTLSVMGGREGMRGIFDDMNSAPGRDLADNGKVTGFSGNMDRHDRSRLRTDTRLDIGGIDVKTTGQRVAEHGAGPEVSDYRSAGCKCISRHKNFVIRLKSYYIERKLQGR